MKAVILAAGKSTRTYPLTVNKPKPLLKILNKSILQHNLEQLAGLVDEAIIVVGFKKEMIMEHLGKSYNGTKITYVVQDEALGTGDALMKARPHIKERFIMLYGDDLHSGKDLARCIKHKYALLAKEVQNPEAFGVLQVEGNKVKGVVEKPKTFVSNLINCGGFVMDKSIFSIELRKTERGELEATDYLTNLAQKEDVFYEIVQDYYIPISYPWSYLEANVFMLRRMENSTLLGQVEDNVVLKGNIHLGEGSVIKSGSYIEGPVYIGDNTTILPQAYIRPDTIILDRCKIRGEVVDSVIMSNTASKHNSYIGHSVIGENVNIGAGTITADYRHDSKNNVTLINGKKVDSGRRKLGSFIGDDVRTGIGTLIYPGRKLWPGTFTYAGEVVKEDMIERELKKS